MAVLRWFSPLICPDTGLMIIAWWKIKFPISISHLWPLTNGIDETAGWVLFLPSGPLGDLMQSINNDTIFMIPEKQHLQLATPLLVDMTQPGKYRRYSQDEGSTIPAGERMNSYLLCNLSVGPIWIDQFRLLVQAE